MIANLMAWLPVAPALTQTERSELNASIAPAESMNLFRVAEGAGSIAVFF